MGLNAEGFLKILGTQKGSAGAGLRLRVHLLLAGSKMRKSSIVLALCIWSASAASKAPDDLVTAKEMLADVQDQHNRAYLRGVWDGLQSANISLEENHQKRLFCQPPKLGIPLDQVISILRRYIGDDHRPTTVALADLPVDSILLSALQNIFPCPSGTR